jgi:pimeloyl-ACP methyl ester carboxylesterase
MAERGRNVSVVVVPDAGHAVHLDQPEQWRRVLSSFL